MNVIEKYINDIGYLPTEKALRQVVSLEKAYNISINYEILKHLGEPDQLVIKNYKYSDK